MKNSIKILSLSLLLTLPACNEEAKNHRLLSDEQIKTVGRLHNQYLIEGLNNLDHNKLSFDELNNAFYAINTPEIDKNLKDEAIGYYGNYIMKQQESETDFVKETLGSSIVNEIIDASIEMSLTFENVDDFDTFIEAKKQEAIFKLDGIDLDTVLLFLEVTQQSARFWSDESVSNKKISTILHQKSCTWKEAIAADGMGAAGGFLRFGVAGLLGGPASLGALIGVVGWSAGYASASYLLLCNY